ncbi:MAG: hypothetical protein ACREQA_00305 [Candidatus Binatia bacterium]
MGKILLIEPHRILRQAISLFLFPEHEVQVQEDIGASGAGSLSDYDLLIVDGAELRERNKLTPEVTRAIQGCKIPTLWLEEDESSHPPKREKLSVVKRPIEKEAFQSALVGLLSPQSISRGRTTKPAQPKEGAKKTHVEEPEQETFQFIDLVDIVEEQPPPGQGKKAPRKSK